MSRPEDVGPREGGATPDHTYRVVARTERFTGRVFTVVTDQVVMPGGGIADRDYLVHCGAVGIVAVDDDDRIAMIYQYRHAVGQRLWELPAGLIDVAGEPLVTAAARELAEEADLTAARWDLLVDLHVSPGCSNEVIRLYLARQLAPVPQNSRHPRRDEEAELSVRMVPMDAAVTMAMSGEITNSACLAGVLATAQARSRGWVLPRAVGDPLPRMDLSAIG